MVVDLYVVNEYQKNALELISTFFKTTDDVDESFSRVFTNLYLYPSLKQNDHKHEIDENDGILLRLKISTTSQYFHLIN